MKIRIGGLGSMLTVLFTGLKLTDVIDWSWWWVLSPMWIPFLILFILVSLLGVLSFWVSK